VAIDFQTVLPQEAIELNRVRLTQLGGLKALDVIGRDFRAVDEVLINDITSPDLLVISKTRLVAQLPDSLQAYPDVQEVRVLSRTLTITPRSVLKFKIGDTPGRVTGILRLLQLFVKILLSDPESDIFTPNLGGGVLQTLGTNFGSDEGESIKSNFIIAVDRVARQIVGMQGKNSSLPRDERLLRATLLGVTFSRAQGALYATIELVSQDGNAARMNLEV